MNLRFWAALITVIINFSAFGDTFFIITEETRNGEAYPAPHPGKEGLLSALFDNGHIVFDTGAQLLAVDWEHLCFKQPLNTARQGGARFLIASQIQSELFKAPHQAARVESRAHYFLLDVRRSTLIGRGELFMDNCGREEELPHDRLLFSLGEEIAQELLSLCRESF